MLSRRGFLSAAGVGAAAAAGSLVSMPAVADDKKKDKKWDVVVVGAGMAGLVCAITAHDAGA